MESSIGRWVTVSFDNCGQLDGIVVGLENSFFKIFFPVDGAINLVEQNNVIKVGKYISPINNGLD